MWEKVQRPIQFGGLGIHTLETLDWSLRIRWLWAQKTDEGRLKGRFTNASPMYCPNVGVAVQTIVGNGTSTKFWLDFWLFGKTIAEHAPNLIKVIPKESLETTYGLRWHKLYRTEVGWLTSRGP